MADRGTSMNVELKINIDESISISDSVSAVYKEYINPNFSVDARSPTASVKVTVPLARTESTKPDAGIYTKESE